MSIQIRRRSRLENLPQEIQTEIISRVAKSSRREVRRIMEASPRLAEAAAQPKVYKNINLRPLTLHPLASLRMYKDLMELCLAAGNLEAHYVRGIQEYFHKNNVEGGLPHLRFAAEGLLDNAIYLYGIIMLSRGEQEIGKGMLDTLGWRENMTRADNCWRSIKRSLHGVRVTRLACYLATLAATGATIACHPENIELRCDSCFYYKQITKFVFMI